MKILFVDTVHSFLREALEKAGHTCVEDYVSTKEEVMRNLKGVSGLVIRSRFRIDREFLDAATDLRFIARAGAGMENIDTVYARQKKVNCISSPEGNRDAVAEHALGMLLSLFNNLCRAGREVREGQWNRESNRGYELQGKVVGIIGYGNTGSAFAARLAGFGCRVLAYDKYKTGFSGGSVEEAGLDKLFREADVVSLHVPLNSGTEYMVNRIFLESFRKPVWLINTSRGKCLNTEDLVYAMKEGKVRGACLDVIEYEDISFESFASIRENGEAPEPWKYLCASDRVVLSPHIAGWSFESYEKISRILFEKISVFLSGKN